MDLAPPALLSPWHTPAREALQQQARAFARDRVLPVADALDPQKAEMPRELVEEMAALGWFGITVPTSAGGLGVGVFEHCLVSEELGYTTERRVERYWRDARLTTISEGTNEVQRRFVSDRVLPRSPLA